VRLLALERRVHAKVAAAHDGEGHSVTRTDVLLNLGKIY
jgi:hypothetical protein